MAWSAGGRILAEGNRVNVNVLISVLQTGTMPVNGAQPERWCHRKLPKCPKFEPEGLTEVQD